jgi:hypothetical protein
MAISPIAIATQGTLNSPLSVAAVRGHLTIADEGLEHLPGGGVAVTGPLILPDEMLERQLVREDEEILAIIIAFMESISNE